GELAHLARLEPLHGDPLAAGDELKPHDESFRWPVSSHDRTLSKRCVTRTLGGAAGFGSAQASSEVVRTSATSREAISSSSVPAAFSLRDRTRALPNRVSPSATSSSDALLAAGRLDG